jgi:fructan beta-fructosidase
MQLLVDGKVVRRATGPNDAPGGSENLELAFWDVSEFQGKEAVIRIVDNATGGWGHINVDQIVQSDNKPPTLVEKSRELVLNRSYLNFPVKTGERKHLVSLEVEGKLAREFEIELAPGKPDFWVFLEVAPFKSRSAVLKAKDVPEDSKVLDTVELSDSIKEAETFYKEPLRPQFHFSPRRGWTNDPNGLVYLDGEYHLFFQHNPYGWAWGNMHWGHAVSPDLVHWKELPIALYTDKLGTMFSGSAIVDTANSLGLNRGDQKALVAFYTAAGSSSAESQGQPFTQCMAYSTDRGRTMTKFEGNPVVANMADGNRDPKVIRHEASGKWIMALYLIESDYVLLGSTDLKHWDKLCNVTIPGTSECPEFFEIPVEGKAGETRWVFYGGNGRYLIGRFDGQTFTPDSGPHDLNFGNCFYASQTYNNEPKGRRIQVAWGQVNFPGMPFNQQQTFPSELTLHETPEGLRLFAVPAREVESLYAETVDVKSQPLAAGTNPFAGIDGALFDIDLTIALDKAQGFKLGVGDCSIAYDAAKQQLSCWDKSATLAPENGRIRLRVLVDRGSVEIYANNGRVYMPMISVSADKRPLNLSGDGATLESAKVRKLKSIWD